MNKDQFYSRLGGPLLAALAAAIILTLLSLGYCGKAPVTGDDAGLDTAPAARHATN